MFDQNSSMPWHSWSHEYFHLFCVCWERKNHIFHSFPWVSFPEEQLKKIHSPEATNALTLRTQDYRVCLFCILCKSVKWTTFDWRILCVDWVQIEIDSFLAIFFFSRILTIDNLSMVIFVDKTVNCDCDSVVIVVYWLPPFGDDLIFTRTQAKDQQFRLNERNSMKLSLLPSLIFLLFSIIAEPSLEN